MTAVWIIALWLYGSICFIAGASWCAYFGKVRKMEAPVVNPGTNLIAGGE